ncbi:copper resistance protein B [Cupriavidus sp. TA19]|uniref:copper resistance protein B n=1 Tax=unclassified Cupriavidus TaxID=2640874 RepID=UPI0026849E48|nr:copper resistance protein B [Cupriavidus sp. TA19]
MTAMKTPRSLARPAGRIAAAVLALAAMGAASAQQDPHVHGQQGHGVPAQDASAMQGMEPMQPMERMQPMQPMEPMEPMQPSGAMDHGDMKMQGGSAPADARDPHAYSGGYQLGVGQYALADKRQLVMADEHLFASVLVDRLEWAHASGENAAAYEVQAWFGNSYDKLVLKAEGEAAKGRMHDARTELLWGHAVASYWDTQLGLRNDAGSGRPARNWLAFGIQGLAPYWFEVDATAYVGTSGRTALRLAAEYELLLTQRLILQPRIEANLYGKNDPETGIGSGLSSGTVGVRLRYEFSRQFAPYIGVERYQAFGNTADMIRTAGGRAGETRFVAGVRLWF